ncbi:phosphoadenylyl-sulfate reductase, partial [Myxococcota bacterium]|nr:phosphoadenylyl-sulfate reductase [Myxococcota bacterium]
MSDNDLRFIRDSVAESLGAQEILTWAVKKFGSRLALSCSFGAPEGLVLLDMMHRIDPEARVFVLDTGRLHPGTHELIERVRDRYDKQVEVIVPDATAVEALVDRQGVNGFYESIENRQRCCGVRKVEPLNRYLAGLDAWVTGLRRDQNPTRSETPKIEIDQAHGGI